MVPFDQYEKDRGQHSINVPTFSSGRAKNIRGPRQMTYNN